MSTGKLSKEKYIQELANLLHDSLAKKQNNPTLLAAIAYEYTCQMNGSGEGEGLPDFRDVWKDMHYCHDGKLVKEYGTLLCSRCRPGDGINILVQKDKVEQLLQLKSYGSIPEGEEKPKFRKHIDLPETNGYYLCRANMDEDHAGRKGERFVIYYNGNEWITPDLAEFEWLDEQALPSSSTELNKVK